MNRVMDALWRALLYCLHPRVIALSLVPLLLLAVLTGAAFYWGWEPAVSAVRQWMDAQGLFGAAVSWLDGAGSTKLKGVIAPLVVLVVAVPLLVIVCLLAVSAFMTPAIVALVADRRFAQLQRLKGAGFGMQVLWALSSSAMALAVLVLSMPLWLIPMVVLILPPFIWGWLTHRILGFDCLADHASTEERKEVLRMHRPQLLLMGVITGYLGTAPGVLGASSVLTIALAPIFIPLALWLYTLVFAFSSAWFAHYCLSALQDLRAQRLRETQAAQTPTVEPTEQPHVPQAPLALPPI
jgi:hypothetical protein